MSRQLEYTQMDNFEKYGIFLQRPVNLQHKTGNGIVFLVHMGFQYNLSES